jgi:hypothetical protein
MSQVASAATSHFLVAVADDLSLLEKKNLLFGIDGL